LVVTSALASNRLNRWFLYDFLEVLDHADNESDISSGETVVIRGAEGGGGGAAGGADIYLGCGELCLS
jgi:hypothetical protein